MVWDRGSEGGGEVGSEDGRDARRSGGGEVKSEGGIMGEKG